MFPLKPLLKWQKLAQPVPATKLRFAVSDRFCEAYQARRAAAVVRDSMQTCYPFPLPWPGPLWVRSFFLWDIVPAQACLWRFGAWRGHARSFAFQILQNSIESLSINNKLRGDLSCVKPLSFLALPALACLAASTMMSRVALPVLRQAVCWRMSQTATSLLARLLAALRAPCVMTSAFVAHVTDRFTAALTRFFDPIIQWPSAQPAPVAILVSWPQSGRPVPSFSKRDCHV